MKQWWEYTEGDVTPAGHAIEIPPVRGRGFDGDDYKPVFDRPRLANQLQRVYLALRVSGRYMSIAELADMTGDGAQSVDSQLRNLRKRTGGCYTVTRRVRGPRIEGLYEFWVGDRGSWTPRKSAARIRAEEAEEWAAELADVLAQLEPEHPSLLGYYEVYGEPT